MTDWLPFFQHLSEALKPVVDLFGKEIGRQELGEGAGGDTTLHIDRYAEEIVLASLEAHAVNTGQGLTVISEEAGTVVFGDGSTLVLVDPIDGSANAKRGLPLYATTLAIADGPAMEDLRCGFTLNHASKETFYADVLVSSGKPKPHRTLYNWLPHHPHTDLGEDHLEMLGLEMPDSFFELSQLEPLIRSFKKTRLLGAMALDLAYVGTGSLDAFVHPKPSRPIDFAGSAVFVLGSGGALSATTGGPVVADLSSLNRGASVAAFRTPAIRDKVLAILAGVG